MAPRDHRIHLGRRDSPKTPSQNHSSAKQLSPGPFVYPKKVPEPKCQPQISPEADFGNFSNSFQALRTANPSEVLSRTAPLKLQTEPRGEKHMCRVFHSKIQSLVFETQHLRFFLRFWTQTWDVWCWKAQICELLLRFGTQT